MERRKISFDPKPSQQELPLDPAPARRHIDLSPSVEVHLRMDKEIAAAISKADPSAVVEHMSREAKRELEAMMTAWSRDRPPCSGYWELKQRSAITPDGHNWWYSAVLNKWHRGTPQSDGSKAGFVEHGVLMQAFEWRGLKKEHPSGYFYVLEQAPFAQTSTLGNAASETEKRGGAFAAAALPDLNPSITRRRIVL